MNPLCVYCHAIKTKEEAQCRKYNKKFIYEMLDNIPAWRNAKLNQLKNCLSEAPTEGDDTDFKKIQKCIFKTRTWKNWIKSIPSTSKL